MNFVNYNPFVENKSNNFRTQRSLRSAESLDGFAPVTFWFFLNALTH